MKRRLLIVLAVAVVAGAAGTLVLQKVGQLAASQPILVESKPATSPQDLEALKTKAEAGDPAAQTSLGWIYQKGDGVKPDMKAAVQWFQRAASQNFPEAQDALGQMTQAGQGVKPNLAEAARLYRLAAENGNVSGQYDLAYLYEQGTGVEKSESEAAKWYQLAAEGGDPTAQYDIGQRYQIGVGVKVDRVQAYKWLALAAKQGQADSVRLLKDLKGQMSADEISQAAHLAEAFTPRVPKAFQPVKN